MSEQKDTRPMLGLAAAAFALILIPILKLSEPRPARVIDEGPDRFVQAARIVDTYWTDAYARQYPDAAREYRTPRVRFLREEDEINPELREFAGYYTELNETISVFIDEPAYYVYFVIAHEFGHHVQKLSGMARARDRGMSGSWSREAQRQIGVRYELQAECLAGVWAYHAIANSQLITRDQVRRWVGAITLGEDSPTHGSARQRAVWFERGYKRGLAQDCDTFAPEWSTL